MQGFNMGRYVPPDEEGVRSGNQIHRKRGPGSTAGGSQMVRFEMPFAVWCSTCTKPTVIGQGVRFNAVKTRAGSYYSTPIFSFRMRHTVCGGEIEIRTDPKNTTYVVVSGGKRRDDGGSKDDSLVGDGPILTDQERNDRRELAFSKLEKTIADREQLAAAKERIGELQDAAERDWDDPYEKNQRLRRAFRVGRKEREEEGRMTENLKDRMSLAIDLVPATQEDTLRAKLIDYGAVGDGPESKVDRALARPLFDASKARELTGGKTSGSPSDKAKPTTKSALAASRTRQNLVSEIVGNTRVTQDPFLGFGEPSKTPVARLPGIKRKRPAEQESCPPDEEIQSKPVAVTGLVSYDSD
jgi:coiled-coil domain-containing protein 130